jgi:hypothetical protein
MNPIVAAIDACLTAREVFDTLSRFFSWLNKTRSDFRAYGPMRIESARDIVTWRAGLSVAARGHLRNKRPLDDLTYMAEVLTAALRRLEALGKR